jgi:hypothetical protein
MPNCLVITLSASMIWGIRGEISSPPLGALVALILATATVYGAASTGSGDAGGFGAAHVRSDAAHVRVHAALGLGWTLYPDRRR